MWSSVFLKLPLLTYSDHKVTFTNPKLTNKVTWSNPNLTNIEPVITSIDPTVTYIVTYSDLQWPTVTYSDAKVTYIDPTHLLLPLPTSPGP